MYNAEAHADMYADKVCRRSAEHTRRYFNTYPRTSTVAMFPTVIESCEVSECQEQSAM